MSQATQTALRKQTAACGGQSSGFYFAATLDDGSGGGPAGAAVVQSISAAGLYRRTRNACGDWPIAISANITEYFRNTPAVDYQGGGCCCEEMIELTTVAQTAFLTLPAGTPAVPATQNAAFTTNQAIKDGVTSEYTMAWGFKYEYDGCHPANPGTSCAQPQCLNLWSQSRSLAGLSPASQHWVEGAKQSQDFSHHQ
jgi:hypothetical protein